jgi:hypothetical protein
MRSSSRKYLALLVTFLLLTSLCAHAFNVSNFMHALDHERHGVSDATRHSHGLDVDEPAEAPPMDSLQHLALHAMGDLQPLALIGFAHLLVTSVTNMTPRSYSAVAPGLPDRDPPFRPPQST